MDKPRDSTEVDREGHRIVFQNDHLRILEVRGDTGTELPLHSHPPSVVIAVGPYRIKSVGLDGIETVIDRRPGDASWIEEEHHPATVLIGPTHVRAVSPRLCATH